MARVKLVKENETYKVKSRIRIQIRPLHYAVIEKGSKIDILAITDDKVTIFDKNEEYELTVTSNSFLSNVYPCLNQVSEQFIARNKAKRKALKK